MEFSILERITLMGVLPQETNYLNYKILTALRADLSFSEKEIKDFKIVEHQTGNGGVTITWDNKKEKSKNIEIGEKAHDIITESLKKLDKEGRITGQNASLYERFVLTVK
jgi:hypothetical protein